MNRLTQADVEGKRSGEDRELERGRNEGKPKGGEGETMESEGVLAGFVSTSHRLELSQRKELQLKCLHEIQLHGIFSISDQGHPVWVVSSLAW